MQVRAFAFCYYKHARIGCVSKSCRHKGFAILPLDIITHSSFVRKQVVATSMCCYLSPALSNGLISSHALVILLSISVRLCVVNHTLLNCLSYVVTTRIVNGGWTTIPLHTTEHIVSAQSQILTIFFNYQRLSYWYILHYDPLLTGVYKDWNRRKKPTDSSTKCSQSLLILIQSGKRIISSHIRITWQLVRVE